MTTIAPAALSWRALVLPAIVLSLANFMVVLDTTITNVALTTISGDLGVSTTEGTWIITAYAVAEAITVPLTGWLARRFGRIRTMRWAYATAVVALGAVVLVPGPALYGVVAVAAIALYVPFSLHITLGQDYLPTRVGTASGVTLGLAVSVGGALAPALGALADATSLRTMLATLVVLPAFAWLLAQRLREPGRLEEPQNERDPQHGRPGFSLMSRASRLQSQESGRPASPP